MISVKSIAQVMANSRGVKAFINILVRGFIAKRIITEIVKGMNKEYWRAL